MTRKDIDILKALSKEEQKNPSLKNKYVLNFRKDFKLSQRCSELDDGDSIDCKNCRGCYVFKRIIDNRSWRDKNIHD